MYGEHPNGGLTDFEPRDVDFLEDVFPSIDEAKKWLELYELEETQDGIAQPHDMDLNSQNHEITEDSGSKPSESFSDSQLRRSSRGNIPRRHFET